VKRYLLVLCFLVLLVPSSASALVRLKNVTQSGRAEVGSINIEFTARYDASDIKTEYYADHVSLIIKDAYTTPPSKRVFKSSSPKSSVLRMEASMIPISKKNSATVRLNIYFRIPIDTIKKTDSLSSEGNFVKYKYKIVAPEPILEADTKTEELIKSNTIKEASSTKEALRDDTLISDNELKSETTASKKDLIIPKSEAINTEKSLRASSLLFRALKILAIMVAILVLLYLAVFFFKKYFQNKPRIYTAPNRPYNTNINHVKNKTSTSSVSEPDNVFSKDINVISTSELEDGKKLYLVEVEGEKILIGSSKDSLNMVAKLAKNEKTNSMMTEEQETAMKTRLKEKLRNF
jgi:hypothetical protein